MGGEGHRAKGKGRECGARLPKHALALAIVRAAPELPNEPRQPGVLAVAQRAHHPMVVRPITVAPARLQVERVEALGLALEAARPRVLELLLHCCEAGREAVHLRRARLGMAQQDLATDELPDEGGAPVDDDHSLFELLGLKQVQQAQRRARLQQPHVHCLLRRRPAHVAHALLVGVEDTHLLLALRVEAADLHQHCEHISVVLQPEEVLVEPAVRVLRAAVGKEPCSQLQQLEAELVDPADSDAVG